MTNSPQIDNRCTADVIFGFVYIDDTRVGFSNRGLWPSRGWPDPTPIHMQTALTALQRTFPDHTIAYDRIAARVVDGSERGIRETTGTPTSADGNA